jgi:hypothetical protein
MLGEWAHLQFSRLTVAPLRGQHFPADVERQPGKLHQSDFGHASFAKAPEQLQLNAVSAAFCTDVSRMSTEPDTLELINSSAWLTNTRKRLPPQQLRSSRFVARI